MTKHEADVIGGLNMTDQISNEAYKQIMIAAQDENEVGEVLDKIKNEIDRQEKWLLQAGYNAYNVDIAFDAIKSVVAESEVQDADCD